MSGIPPPPPTSITGGHVNGLTNPVHVLSQPVITEGRPPVSKPIVNKPASCDPEPSNADARALLAKQLHIPAVPDTRRLNINLTKEQVSLISNIQSLSRNLGPAPERWLAGGYHFLRAVDRWRAQNAIALPERFACNRCKGIGWRSGLPPGGRCVIEPGMTGCAHCYATSLGSPSCDYRGLLAEMKGFKDDFPRYDTYQTSSINIQLMVMQVP